MSATADEARSSAAVMLNNKLRRERNRDLASRMIRKSGDRFSGWIMRLERPPMVEKSIMSSRNVIDLSRYRERNVAMRAPALSPRSCRHCGAALLEGEREEECSSAFNADALRLRWQAAQILRGLI
jgi:hypothetical protein